MVHPDPAPAAAGGATAYTLSLRTVYSTPKGGGLFWLLGFVVSGAILYYFFVFAPRAYSATDVLLIAVGAAFLGGAITRKGGRGAVVGFLVFFAPIMALAVILLVGVAGVAGQAEGLETLVPLIGTAAALVLIAVAFAAGIVGLVVAGIGGWVAGKIVPLGGRG